MRRQLTLLVNKMYTKEIEAIRRKYNPVQYALINAHVTLCREDEIQDIQQILENLKNLNQKLITISFEKVERFSDGKGVLISAHEHNTGYHALRKKILENTNQEIRFPKPHITLMHPENSTCTDEIFEEIQQLKFPKTITFNIISLIEQFNTGKWKILQQFRI
ncbi:hypothetical protein DC498_14690 [Terrimonas sp.]|uniref:2'-5' RNA ligase family protein n=1 Tax=Terrimonas sp. TaxID=1914338 RepID=UPI000D512C3B|nr:2'-5' RNA ligase family protein [Terrimonas sp.]PVD51386.1 hypothetical protein DC498_14690 [Terrimonas sp.]